MLVLSRRTGQRIVMTLESGETITLTLVDSTHNKSKLGIEAPRSVTVYREEITQKPDFRPEGQK